MSYYLSHTYIHNHNSYNEIGTQKRNLSTYIKKQNIEAHFKLHSMHKLVKKRNFADYITYWIFGGVCGVMDIIEGNVHTTLVQILDKTVYLLSKFLRRSLVIFIRKSFLTIVFGFILFSQRFGCCILRPSSGVPCLSGHRNDSTREIIFKSQVESFLFPDKQGTPEVGQKIQWLKCCENKNKDEDNSPKTLDDKKDCLRFT